jgi:four helix bundle protein
MKDQAHFTQIAYGSLMELACQMTVAGDLGYVDVEKGQVIRLEIVGLASKLNALRASQLARVTK